MKMNVDFREASPGDLQAIIHLLAHDKLGETRETLTNPLPKTYIKAFDKIFNDPKQKLVVAVQNNEILHLSY